jgi:medium-chain acyl-[acyl-carrier-protein] hydrolase
MSPTWSEPFTVHTYEVDVSGRASIQSLCAFLQEAAGRNAHALGVTVPQLMEHGLTWVLSRLLVRVYDYPGWWDKLVIETWPSGFRRLFALRDWRIFRGDELLGEATGAWLMVQVDSRRPIRPDSHGEWAGSVHPQRAIPLTLEKLPEPDPAGPDCAAYEGEFVVRYRDLDMNGHANNISYLDWLLEVLPLDFRERHSLRELELNFLAELGAGERVRSQALMRCPAGSSSSAADAGSSAGGTIDFDHGLNRLGDSQIAARARSSWVPRE